MEAPDYNNLKLTLPVASKMNFRRIDAAENKQPFLSPNEAAVWVRELQKGGKNITAITLHGPGDVLASWQETRQCLSLLTEHFSQTPVSMTTIGLNGLDKIDALANAGLIKITLRVDALTAETAGSIYQWIRPAKKTIPVAQGCSQLVREQPQFCRECSDAGIDVVIRTKVEPTNKNEIVKIAKTYKKAGALAIELCGTVNEELISAVNEYLPAISHKPEPILPPPKSPSSCNQYTAGPTSDRSKIAVASQSGIDVDLHLGQAGQLLIYGKNKDGLPCLLETRTTPPAGDPDRWKTLAEKLSDCFCLLATHAGLAPREQLAVFGLKVILTDDQIDGVVDLLLGNPKKGCKN